MNLQIKTIEELLEELQMKRYEGETVAKIPELINCIRDFQEEVDSLNRKIIHTKSNERRLKEVVESLSLCQDHMENCYYFKYLEDDNIYDLCNCYDHDFYNFENMIKKAREVLKDLYGED